jgi:hypothetical protein
VEARPAAVDGSARRRKKHRVPWTLAAWALIDSIPVRIEPIPVGSSRSPRARAGTKFQLFPETPPSVQALRPRFGRRSKMLEKQFGRAFTVVCLAFVTFAANGCAASQEGDEEDTASSTSEAFTSVGNCQLHAYAPNSSRFSSGKITCPNKESLKIQVCMQQLISGGWSTMQWTCVQASDYGTLVFANTPQIPYYTKGRWYRTWTWGSANGHPATYVSSGIQG